MATQQGGGVVPDFPRIEYAGGPDSPNPHRNDTWYGCPSKRVEALNLLDA